MKKQLLLALFTIALLCSVSTMATAKSETSDEYQKVITTAYNYFNGAANGDVSLLESAFDTEYGDVKMIRVDKETKKDVVRTVPLKEFAGYFNKPTKDSWQAKILSVDIVDDTMAVVKMDFTTPRTHYIDYLVMYKRNDNWKIINKTFVAKNITK